MKLGNRVPLYFMLFCLLPLGEENFVMSQYSFYDLNVLTLGVSCEEMRQHFGQVAFIFSLLFGLITKVYKLRNMKSILFLK